MGLFDFLGPLNAGGRRRGWDALPPESPPRGPSPAAPTPETRAVDFSRPGPFALDGARSYWTPMNAPVLGTADAAGCSAVEACLGVLASSVGEPPLNVYRPGPSGGADRAPAPLPALVALLARPNPALTLASMLSHATVSTRTEGNGYWRKIRSGDPTDGNVVELWPVAPSRIEPFTRTGSDDFISWYRYTDEHGRSQELPTKNVVHFRYGIDPSDHRLGYAPLRKLVAEIASDQQATRYAARLLQNLAINGLTLAFDKESPPIDQATADELKARIASAYGGDNVGATAVLSPGATLTALGFSPSQMDLATLHRVPEERISAVLGVPAAMVGLGVGLEHSIYNNVRQAEEHFTERTLIPEWKSLATTLTMSLLPDFTSERAIFLDFDTSAVRALQEDQDALAARLVTLVAAGILTIDEARASLDKAPLPAAAAAVPPEARHRPYMVRLPARKAVDHPFDSQARSGQSLLGGYDALRRSSLPDWERELDAFLRAQGARVAGRATDGHTAPYALVPESEAVLLGGVLSPLQLAMLDDLVPLVETELGIGFRLDDPATRAFLREAGANVGAITDTTRREVQAALLEGQAAGEGIPELARRLRGLPSFGSVRALLVARTELGLAQMEGSYASYVESGVVVGVRVLDGDTDAACAARNGTTLTLEQAASATRLMHPQCTAAWAPLTDSAALTMSA